MSSKRTIIFNPFSKSERAGPLWYEVYKLAGKAKIKLTKKTGNATKKARKSVEKGSDIVIAAGGDGTINEVVNGIMGSGATLGILPIGSVNVLARELKIPLTLSKAWEVIEKGFTREVDLICVDFYIQSLPERRYAIQLAGVGIDAQIVQRVRWQDKKRWGPFSYVLESFKSIADPLPPVTLQIDNQPETKASFVLIGNGSFYGGPFPVFPKASMFDGLIDVCSFESVGYFDLMVYLQALWRGAHDSTKGVLYRQASTVKITSSSEVPIELDGEFAGHLPATFTVIPKALKVLVPENLENAPRETV